MTSLTLLYVSQSCFFFFFLFFSFLGCEVWTSSTVPGDRWTVNRLVSVPPRETRLEIFQFSNYSKSVCGLQSITLLRGGERRAETPRRINIRQFHNIHKPQPSLKIETLSNKTQFSKAYLHKQLFSNITAKNGSVWPNIGVELRTRTGSSEHSRHLTTWGLVPPLHQCFWNWLGH